jgi:hypothetical protein
MTPSERIVSCRVTGNEWRGRTLFSIDPLAPGVEPEADEDAGAEVEVSQDGTQAAG